MSQKPRIFTGNRNYLRFFNAQLRNEPSSHDLHPSYVKLDLSGLGTFWSLNEKEKFFLLLSKYSIHNSDLISIGIGTKSEAEVHNYYRVLKQRLHHYKSKTKKRHRLVRLDEIPIAYEMSNDFAVMEEIQLHKLAQLEKISYTEKLNYAIDNEDTLINLDCLDEMIKLHTYMVVKTRPRRPFLREVHLHFTTLMEIFLRRVLLNLIRQRYFQNYTKVFPKLQDVEQMENMGFDITALHVRNSVAKMYPNIFQSKIDWSRNLLYRTKKMERNYVAKEERTFEDDVTFETLFEMEELDFEVSVSGNEENEEQYLEEENSEEEDIDDDELMSMPIHELLKSSESTPIPQDGEFVVDDKYPVIDNNVAETLLVKETSYVNAKDLKESRYHEHVVLTYLSTYMSPELGEDSESKQNYLANCKEFLGLDEEPMSDCCEIEEENPAEEEEVTPEMLAMLLYNYAQY